MNAFYIWLIIYSVVCLIAGIIGQIEENNPTKYKDKNYFIIPLFIAVLLLIPICINMYGIYPDEWVTNFIGIPLAVSKIITCVILTLTGSAML